MSQQNLDRFLDDLTLDEWESEVNALLDVALIPTHEELALLVAQDLNDSSLFD